ncbi:NFX1-type zinc finger-containing protein 1 [Seminavis robusta]|uniref:NFX1-type zinc finger-containing protein 1 n=1 Tax=Seminavis robusta TaxID=568900 RepID=A0A9N8HQX3_9STRA|nr:NFX1-type zinc finger-containing protein 1 [Seminavis robusta]|eukprot:Sro1497_g277570.1 NFX1-type zinc finger-containing protein 1 (1284) ;mRNA; f:3110-7770
MRRGGYSNRNRSSGRPDNWKKRSVFTKLLKDENADMRDTYHARRFLEGMETFESKAELLSELDNPRNEGKRRLRDLLSFINSSEDVEELLIPLLGHVMNQETQRPVYRPLLNKMLLEIYHTPLLMHVIDENCVVEQLSGTSANQFCSFLRTITKAFMEPRKCQTVQNLAKGLRERGDVDEAKRLCALLLLDEREEGELHLTPKDNRMNRNKPKGVACWVTDLEPPGGRHDNDHLNYRDIRIVPTVAELACEDKPYLPLASGENNFINDPVAALLDRNFRLLREDAVSSMRTNIAESETKCWKNARIVDIHVSSKKPRWSVFFVIQCDSRSGGASNWKRLRAFMHGSVVALCRGGRPVRMGTVALREDSIRGEWLNDPNGPRIGVLFESQEEFRDSIEEMVKNCAWNDNYCKSMAELSDVGRNDPYRNVLDERIQVCAAQMETYDLVEVSKSFFAYQPILRTLQGMDSLPLSHELTGAGIASQKPAYLPEEITLPEKDFGGVLCDLSNFSVDNIVEQTTLDKSQAEALKHTLTSSVVLTQGPPGTGKTFIGALVARIIRENTDESILCVCHTNHALDQFLEHLLSMGETRIVRMGGRSKSDKLSRYQLKDLARSKSQNSTSCQKRIKQVHAHLYQVKESIEEIIDILKTPLGWRQPSGGMEEYLVLEAPKVYEFFRVPTGPDDGQYNVVGRKGKKLSRDFLWNCWKQGEGFPLWLEPHMSINQNLMKEFYAFWNLTLNQRAKLIDEWRRDIMGSHCDCVADFMEDFSLHAEEDKTLCREAELEILRSARVIGATTAGAAVNHDILSAKAAGVIVVEEAGEVLESHVLTALAGGTSEGHSSKHLILIGDHKQLPPKVENYDLTTTSGNGLNLDCSLFERLILGGRPSAALAVQHRMRPTISALIRSQTYPLLRDHESVSGYPDVKGVSENLLFIDHNIPEDGADEDNTTTKSNDYEANLCVEIVRFLLLQGYRTDQLVVLTPYLGQLLSIMNKLKSIRDVEAVVSDRDIEELDELEAEGNSQSPSQSFATSSSEREKKGVRCSSIDNYQGEESDIVVISLVRSNKQGNIGFMKERQRVNVLLSRARHGMFLVGNSSTLRSSGKGSAVWTPILEQLTVAGRVTKGLPTICQLHPNDEPIELCHPKEFRGYRPNGGCLRQSAGAASATVNINAVLNVKDYCSAGTNATVRATRARSAHPARNHVAQDAAIRRVHGNVNFHVLHVWNAAIGNASTKVNALSFVVLHAPAFPAMSDALKSCRAATNALRFVAKIVPTHPFANSAVQTST